MKQKVNRNLSMIILIVVITSCSQELPSTTQLVLTDTPLPFKEPTFTATISPADRKEKLKHFLQTNGNCTFPCFWGIQSESTTRGELYNLFQQLGKKGSETNIDNHLYISSTFHLNLDERGGLYVVLQADSQEDIVRNMTITIDGLWDPDVFAQDWSAYSLDEVLRTYGPPSSVELYLDFPYEKLKFGIRLRYEEIDTSIFYDGGYKSNAQNHTATDATICPKENIGGIKLHTGKHPFNYEPSGVLLSDATKLDIRAFHKIFVENPSACLTVDLASMGWK